MKCANLRCTCRIEEGKPFCSEECERGREERQERCPCGHADCSGQG